jgi:hypothetical protein
VIVAVFSGTPRDGHGHHQVSGMLAREVFEAAADSIQFPRTATLGLGAWTPQKFYRAARFNPAQATVRFNVGELSALRGRTYAEIASESRSQHLSQGFGVLERRGTSMDYLTLEASRLGTVGPEQSPLDGLETGWSRFTTATLTTAGRAALDSLPAAIAGVRRVENLTAPAAMVAPLARVVHLLTEVRQRHSCGAMANVAVCGGVGGDLGASVETALRRATTALLAAAGVQVEATAPRELVAVGDTIPITISVYNQGPAAVTLLDAQAGMLYGMGARWRGGPMGVAPDSAVRASVGVLAQAASVPWWLSIGKRGDVFALPAMPLPMALGEERLADSYARVTLNVAGGPVTVDAGPIVYRFADPARGERRRPLTAVPPISVTLDGEMQYARAGVAVDRRIDVHVASAATAPRSVTVTLTLPAGLRADSVIRRITLDSAGTTSLSFLVRGSLPAGRHAASVMASSNGEDFAIGYLPIDYEHIRPLRYYRQAAALIESVDAALPRNPRIAYVRGVGDNVAPMLMQLGVQVKVLAPDELERTDLSGFGAVVVGPRAFAATPELVSQAPRLQAFARAGGTVVVQYGQAEMQRPGLLPYPITLAQRAARVTDERAPVRVIAPSDRLLTTPNRISAADFERWVQERAVYMPSSFDPRYRAPLEMNDPGEPANRGAILVAPLGRGAYVYTTLAFFRQLPAGVPGAARLFLNLLGAGGGGGSGIQP